MKIAVYIEDLLYDYECVVIPGLGGFLSRDYPASIHPVKHYFTPPYREVVFNPWLRANDGLLLNHIALNEKLSYHEAKSKLDRFVLKCLSALSQGKKIHFRNVGSLYYDKDQQIVFEPEAHRNFLPDAFGLTGFVSPPVKRDEGYIPREPVFARPPVRMPDETPPPAPEPNLKKTPKRPMVASHRPSGLRRQLVILTSAAAALLAGAAYMNKSVVSSYYHQYIGQASILPLFYASPGEYLLMHMDKLPKDMVLISKELHKPQIDEKKIRQAADDLLPAKPYRPETNNAQESPIRSQDSLFSDEGLSTVTMGYTNLLPELAGTPKQSPAAEIEPFESETLNKASVALRVQNVSNETATTSLETMRGFYIVAGAFREKANAEKLVYELRAKQFDACLAGRTSNGLWRVSYERLDNRSAALNRLNQIKQTVNNQAWLLVI